LLRLCLSDIQVRFEVLLLIRHMLLVLTLGLREIGLLSLQLLTAMLKILQHVLRPADVCTEKTH
jgi:hypothetical protein